MFPFTVSKFIWISRVSLVLLDKLFRCSIFKVLILFEFAALVKQLIHYITSLWVCQVLFQNFFWFFFDLFCSRFSEMQLLYYIILFSVCQVLFQNFFWFFSWLTFVWYCLLSLYSVLHSLSCSGSLEYLSVRLTFASLVLPFRESALLLYAFRPVLSRLFSYFFAVCQVCLFTAVFFAFGLVGLHNGVVLR